MLEKKLIDVSTFNTKSIVNSKEYKDTPEYKALNLYSKKGINGVSMEYKDYLRTDVGAQGNFLVPTAMVNFMLNEIQEISPVRQLVRKITIETKSIEIPIGVGIPDAPFEKELESGTRSTPTYRMETLTAFAQQTTIPVSRDILAFSSFDVEAEVVSKANQAFAKAEGNKILTGTGIKEPQGILNSSVAKIETASSGAVTFDEVIKLAGETKQGYKESYFFNKKTLVALRTMKNGANEYLWRIGGESMPTEINGYPYIIFQDMPDIASAALPIGFGDLFEGYTILDSLNMSMLRDEYTPKDKRAIEFTFYRYLTGQVIMPEAIKLIKIKA